MNPPAGADSCGNSNNSLGAVRGTGRRERTRPLPPPPNRQLITDNRYVQYVTESITDNNAFLRSMVRFLSVGQSGPSISASLYFLIQSRTQGCTNLPLTSGESRIRRSTAVVVCVTTSPVFSRNSSPGAARTAARTCIY